MKRLFGLLVLLGLVCIPLIANAVPPISFAPHVDFPAGDGAYGVAVGDLNRDGKPDLAAANANASTVSVLLGNGAGSFAAKTDFATGSGPWSVAVGDLNGDGKPDLATPNFSANTVSVLLGDGAGSFAAKTDLATGNRPYVVAIGDLNHDGRPDLAVADELAPGAVSVLLNTTTAGAAAVTFGPTTDFATGSNASSVVIGDFNGDGNPDLAVSKHYANRISVLLGNGDGSFGAYTDFPTGNFPHSLVIGDLNRDGKPDLAAGDFGANTVSVLLNTTPAGATTATFAQNTDFATGGGPFLFAIGDLNADGKLDLATANYNASTVSVLLGNGDGSFEPNADFAIGSISRSIAIGDLNRDGKLDLATTNYTANTISVLLNNIVCGVLDVATPPPSDRLELSAAPNPTSGQTNISFTLPTSGPATVAIYDVLGRRLRQWDWSTMTAGQHQVEWNGLAEDGHRVPPSVLFYRLSAGGQTLKEKITRMQ